MQPFSSLLPASVLPPASANLPSVQPPTFVRFLTFLYWLLSLLYFSHFALTFFFILRCHIFFFINSCAFPYCLSSLLPDEASGRNVVNSTVCCSTVCCSLSYYTSMYFVLNKCPNFFSVAHFGAAILVFFCPLLCCLLLLPPCLLFNHLRSSAFSPFSTAFCHFCIIHTSLSPFYLHKLISFLMLSFISLT